MSLAPGSRLGVYEVISIVGRGGMGEVYRARDTRLGRDVALKMLPPDKLSDLEWHTRFEREARALATLNHPNIAAIYGLEEGGPAQPDSAPNTAIVMELVDGETLADRLTRGALPVEEALTVAGQIADALDAAHQKGIVHCDLKPANVKITSGGAVKVLDFGIARVLADPAHDEGTRATVTGPAVLLGTPAYMAPEQVQGRPADTRMDVWAFGVVLYEMVTAARPFRGQSLQDTLAAVLTSDPEWDRVPPAVQPLLRACLERDPRKRLRDIADHRFLLPRSSPPPASARGSAVRSLSIAAMTLGAVMLAFFAGQLLTGGRGPSSAPAPIRFSTLLPAGVSVTRGPGHTSSVAVSPDGRTVVIAGTEEGGQRLYRRSLDRLDPEPLAGTERGTSPFFSWDGAWIGFFADGRLKRIPAGGGAAVDIADAPGFSAGASWGPDDRIVFAYGADSLLHVVPAMGGKVEALTRNAPGRQPEVLPDGNAVLFEEAGHIHAYDRKTGTIKKLLAGTAPRYGNGYLIFSRGITLLAAPIDVRDLSTGAANPVAEGVAVELPGSGGGRHYAISRSGTLVYVPAAEAYDLVIVGANGVEHAIWQPQRSLENPRFSPDGQYVVVAARRRDDEPTDLWVHDLRKATATRLTSDGGRSAIWTTDSTITYSHLGEQPGIYTTRLDGAGAATRVVALSVFHWLVGATADRSALLYGVMGPGNGSSIMAYGDTQSRTVVGPGSTWGGRLSRDGKWLTYYALNSGTFEVYVTPFPEGGRRWLIAEGTDPSWAPDGNEIYYRSGPRLMAARVDKAAGVTVSATRVVVEPFLPPLYDDYDVHGDGRIVMVRPTNKTQGREVTMILGWFSDFRPAGR